MRTVALALAIAFACSPIDRARPPSPAAAAGADAPSGGVIRARSPIPSDSGQLITVVSASWRSVPGRLQRYRAGSDTRWQPVGGPVAVVLGKNGLGWGIGLHPTPPRADPAKREGDGRSPAGIFRLETAFGYAPPAAAGWLALPYLEATDDLECVDDPASAHYNALVYRSSVGSVDWTSSERMKRTDLLYRWGVVVDHNTNPARPGAGSCIFLHSWSSAARSTAGCTAGDEARMKEVYHWLDPALGPVLVQLPASVYERLRSDWGLP